MHKALHSQILDDLVLYMYITADCGMNFIFKCGGKYKGAGIIKGDGLLIDTKYILHSLKELGNKQNHNEYLDIVKEIMQPDKNKHLYIPTSF